MSYGHATLAERGDSLRLTFDFRLAVLGFSRQQTLTLESQLFYKFGRCPSQGFAASICAARPIRVVSAAGFPTS